MKQDPALTLRSLNFGRSQHCCTPSQNFGKDSLSLSHLIYATDCKSSITSCQLAGFFILDFGAVHKVRHALGEGVQEGVTVCDRGRVKSMWRHAYKFFYHIYETWNFKWYLTFCCNTCILREGGTDKTFQTKEKTPGQKPPRTIKREFVPGGFCQEFCTRPTKNRGGWVVRDVWHAFGGLGMRDKVWQREGGSKLAEIAWRILWTAPFHVNAVCFKRLTGTPSERCLVLAHSFLN